MKKLSEISADMHELFFGVDAALKHHVTATDKCLAFNKFLPLVAEFLCVGEKDPEFIKREPLIRYYLGEVEGYTSERGKYGGIRKLRDGEPKKKDKNVEQIEQVETLVPAAE